MADPDFSKIGAALRHARLQMGWSQEYFAEKAILSVPTIRAAESGARVYPRTYRALIDAINKARAACNPPVGPLILEFPVGRAYETDTAQPTDPASPGQAAPGPGVYPEASPAEHMVNDDPITPDATIPIPDPVGKGDPPRLSWADDKGLLHAGNDAWRIKDACEGVVIFGATGSGKTSGSGQTLARAYLGVGFGGLVLCAKPDEPALWTQYAAKMVRQSDLILFGTDPRWTFNFLEHESRRQGAGASLTENLVNLFTEIASIGAGSAGGSTSDPFWDRAMRSLVRNCVDLLAAAGVPVTLHNMFDVVRSAPTSLEVIQSEEWRQASSCWRHVQVAQKAVSASGHRIDLHEVIAYWLDHFPTLGERTRSSIVAMFITLAEALMRSKMRELFCSGTTVAPEDILAGKIVIVDLPVKEWGEVGRIAAVLWKYCFQKTVERRKDNSNGQGRPVFLWADECQYFVSRHDALFQATARSSRAATVYLTQSIPSLVAAVGAEQEGRALVDSLLNNLITKIFHANSDTTTNEYASKLIGKTVKRFGTAGRSVGPPPPGGWFRTVTQSSGYSEQLDDIIHPNEFSRLGKGGPENRFLVHGIIVQMGRVFGPSKQYWHLVAFKQRPDDVQPEPPILVDRSVNSVKQRYSLGPLSPLMFPWRHFKGNVSVARWVACVLVWAGALELGSFFALVVWRQLLYSYHL